MSNRSGTPETFQRAGASAAGDELIDAFRLTGAPADFERVVARYAPLVFAECRRVTRDAHDAEDAAQLTFLALAIELRGGATLRRPAAWLQRVAQRQALKLVRARGRRRRREDAARRADRAPTEPLQLELADRERYGGAVRDAIDQLTERYRLPLVLHYFGGLSLEAIAGELGIKRQAVGTRLFRARKMLAARLAERGITISDAMIASCAATLVPAAVIANVLKRGAPVIAQAGPGATFAQGLATLVGIAAGAGGRKPAVAAAAALAMAAASGFALVAPSQWTQAVRATLDVRAWTRWLTEAPLPRPTLAPIVTPTPFAEASPPLPIEIGAFALASVESPTSPPVLARTPAVITANASIALSSESAPTIAATLLGGPFDFTIALAPPPALTLARIGAGVAPLQTRGDDDASRETAASATIADRAVHQTGDASFDHLAIGGVGVGAYDLAGGRLKVSGLTLGAAVGAAGTLHVGGGTLELGRPQTPVIVGGLGSGRLYLGTQDAPGQIVASPGADARLVVRATARANGLIRGWGDVDSGGTLVNNGRIVADGFERSRSLRFSSFETVSNAIDNPRDGTNGWYARRGGRLVLPAIQFDARHQTATWGESGDDATIDLVNSVRVNVAGLSAPGTMRLTLHTVGLADPLETPLPVGATVIGLYDVASVGLDGNATFTVRYDHVAAASTLSGEFGVRLLAHADGSWIFARDPLLSLYRRTVTGTFDASIDALAIVVGSVFAYPANRAWTDGYSHLIASSPGGTIASLVGAGLAQVPEPAMLLVGVGAVALVARRRRR